MSLIHLDRPITDQLLTHLRSTGLLVGDGRKPAGSGWQGTAGQSVFKGYAVLDNLGGPVDGSLGQPDDTSIVTYQVTSWGRDPAQADIITGLMRTLMSTVNLAVDGRSVGDPIRVLNGESLVYDVVQPPIYAKYDRYRLWTVPG
ncbi:hypothetical protein BH24ACT15_BH24ACT15_37520 [soil metagenome]